MATKKEDAEVHFVMTNEERGEGYYRLFLTCSDGEVVCGAGDTENAALRDANFEKRKHERFINKPAKDQLLFLTSQKEMGSLDMQMAIKLLAKMVLR